ncbi:MAG: hydrogenase expression/formation protein HypE [Fibrobacteria bacterium]|nr:hydrogenase expression/formation protein HypE [Fibrobacteria bacterium]
MNASPAADSRLDETIRLGHGSGGRLSRELLDGLILPALGPAGPGQMDDGAIFSPPPGDLVFTTDSHVVTPLEFPGGDLGTLCVSGTVNDLAVMGARPLALSLGLILEEGLPMDTLRRILESVGRTASASGVRILCGDTKVVERGKGDGIFVNTAGIGHRIHRLEASRIRPGDAVVVSGNIGDHGFALLTQRKGFPLESPLRSDAAPLFDLIHRLCEKVPVRWMRDPTRGGVATALCELCQSQPWSVTLTENSLPLDPAVRGISEILGLDPLYSANEGKFLAVLPAASVDAALEILRSHELGGNAARIGTITEDHPGKLLVATDFGNARVMGMLASDPLPRIC